MNTLNADVYAVQEVSDDAALDLLLTKISINGKTLRNQFSSLVTLAPDANFPPQKLVVILHNHCKRHVYYSLNCTTKYAGTNTPNYPGGDGSSFYSSGRLPYLVEIETNIGGVKKTLKL
jgi:hypothetical protein